MTRTSFGNVTEYVLRGAHDHLDRTAILETESGNALTYRQLIERVDLGRARLAEADVRPADVVALMAPNGIDYPVAFHAVASLGAIVTTMNPSYRPEELSHQPRDSRARVLLASPDLLDQVRAAIAVALQAPDCLGVKVG